MSKKNSTKDDPSPDNPNIENPDQKKTTDNGAESGAPDELKKFKHDYLYLRAEFDNYKRRSTKERAELIKFGSEPLAKEILNILDVFELALSSEVTPENIDSFKKGMDMTYGQLQQSLERFNITKFGSLGDKFDPQLHEALSSLPSSDFEPEHICQVFKNGFKFHDKVIRPAQVVVASAPTEPPPGEETKE